MTSRRSAFAIPLPVAGAVLGGLICQLGLGFGYVFGPLAGEIIEDFAGTRANFSAATAPQLWVISFASPAVGALVLRFGARRVLIASTLLLTAVFLGFSRMQTLWQLAGLTVVMGLVVVGLGDITVGQLVTQWVARARGSVLGFVYTGSNLAGWLLVPYVIHQAGRSGWRTALFQLSVIGLVVLVPTALFLIREPTRDKDAGTQSVHEPVGGDADLPLARAMRTRSFWILFGTIFSFFFYFMAILDHLVLFLTDNGLSRADATFYFTSAIGAGLVSKLVLGVIADFIPHHVAIVLDYGLLALSSLILLLLPNSNFLWPFVVTYGFATAARDVVYPLMIIHCFGERYLAPIYGAMMVAMAPGGSLGKIFAGHVFDELGSYRLAFWAFVLVNMTAAVALMFLRDERSRAPLEVR